MQTYSQGRKGRRQEVDKFTIHKGLWMVLTIAAAMIVMMVLWLVGIFLFDVD